MIKINLKGNEFTFTLASSGRVQSVEIKNGFFNGRRYDFAMIEGENLILQGEDICVLTGAVFIEVSVKSAADRIALLLNDSKFRFTGIEGIPQGKEREILLQIIEDSL